MNFWYFQFYFFDLVMLADHEVDKYDNGNGFLHFGTAVEDESWSCLTCLLAVWNSIVEYLS